MLKWMKEQWKNLWKVEIPEEISPPIKYHGLPSHYSKEEKIQYLKGFMINCGREGWQRGGQKIIYAINGILDILEEDAKDG